MGVDPVELTRISRPSGRGFSIGYDEDSKELLKALRALPAGLRKNIAVAVREGARLVAQDARDLLGKTRARGRRVKVGPLRLIISSGRGEASMPGDPPAQQSGELRRSIRVQRLRRDGLAFRVEAEFYALFLEFGATGPGRRRVEPRPFLSAALESRRDVIEAMITEQVVRALEAAQKGSPA